MDDDLRPPKIAEPAPRRDTGDRPVVTAVWVAALVVVAAFAAVLSPMLVDRFSTPGADSVDVGFVQDMTAHHDQAVQMSLLALATADDPEVRHFAQEVIIAQRYEIGYMGSLLEEWGAPVESPSGDAMAWMGMATPTAEMPGMASEDDLTELAEASPAEANALFLELMTEHHRGGVHMAAYAAKHASDPRVAELAERMERNQAAEIAEYDAAADRLKGGG